MKATERVYGWGGWRMPMLHLNDPEYCELGCPISTRARKGVSWALAVQKAEMALTFGGCPWGRARRRKYGVMPHQAVPKTTH